MPDTAAIEITSPEGSSLLKLDAMLKAKNLPAWLSAAYVQDILRKFHRDDKLKVAMLSIKPCGGLGESYISMMFRVEVQFSSCESASNSVSLIMKTIPQNNVAATALGPDCYDVQNKEIEFYEQIIPEFNQILESVAADTGIFPKVYAVDRSCQLLVLEDMMSSNFVMADRHKGLNLEHIQLVLRKLAAMHAASAIVYEKNKEEFKIFNAGIFTRKVDVFHSVFNFNMQVFTDEVASWKGWERYAEKLKKLQPKMIERINQATDCVDGDFHVLTHGDLHSNNMIFKYDNGKLLDLVFIDFQFACFGSPAVDLLYVLHTSTATADLRLEKAEELVQYYYYQLHELLVKLKYNMAKFPSLHKFQMQMHGKCFFAFASAFLMFPILTATETDGDFESLMGCNDKALAFKRRLYKNPRFQEVAKKVLPFLDRKGLLDDEM